MGSKWKGTLYLNNGLLVEFPSISFLLCSFLALVKYFCFILVFSFLNSLLLFLLSNVIFMYPCLVRSTMTIILFHSLLNQRNVNRSTEWRKVNKMIQIKFCNKRKMKYVQWYQRFTVKKALFFQPVLRIRETMKKVKQGNKLTIDAHLQLLSMFLFNCFRQF